MNKILINQLTILHTNKEKATCQCTCGNICVKRKYDVISGKIKSCGCLYKTSHINIGDVFTKLEVISIEKNNKVKVKCECGTIKIVRKYELLRGDTKSCGCETFKWVSRAHSIHNYTGTRIYYIYYNMINRCYQSSYMCFELYGGRGIRVCQDWLYKPDGFLNFLDWAKSHGYQDHLELDRIDNDCNYCPTNCKWSTEEQQSNNKRISKFISYNGISKTIAQWGKDPRCIVNERTFAARIRYGWNLEKAWTTPPIKK